MNLRDLIKALPSPDDANPDMKVEIYDSTLEANREVDAIYIDTDEPEPVLVLDLGDVI